MCKDGWGGPTGCAHSQLSHSARHLHAYCSHGNPCPNTEGTQSTSRCPRNGLYALVAATAPHKVLTAAVTGPPGVRCAFSDRNVHSRMPLVPTPFLSGVHSSYRFTL
jgi:hypothetical protein